MSKIQRGTNPLIMEELTGLVDGSKAYRYQGIVSEYPDDQVTNDLEWICEPDPDDHEVVISIDPELLAVLVRGAKAHCPSCEGCTRS